MNLLQHLRKKYLGNEPAAATLYRWEKIRCQQKKEHPIAYFLLKTLPHKLRFYIYKLERIKWKILHRVHPEHRYNIVRTGLKPGYYDIDVLMLHSVMTLICRYVEDERNGVEKLKKRIQWLKESTDLENKEEYIDVEETALKIYTWWKVDHPALVTAIENLRTRLFAGINTKFIGLGDGSDIDPDDVHDYHRYLEEKEKNAEKEKHLWELEEELNLQEQDMLMEAIRIRKSLWT